MVTPGDTAGWYGKLPMLGDFAHRRLPLEFVNACDAWLSTGIAASRESLGATWLDTYLSAPLWCFAWSPQVVNASWWFGVMMPSVDAVGRYFPLVLAFSAAHAPTEPPQLAQWAQWYEHACECALQTLHDQATLDAFEVALQALGVPSAAAPLAELDSDGAEWQFQPTSSGWPADAATLVLRTLAARVQAQSIWWPQSLRQLAVPTPATAMPGLPASGRFAAMLRGAL